MVNDYDNLQRYIDLGVDKNTIEALSAQLTSLGQIPGSYRHYKVSAMQFTKTNEYPRPRKVKRKNFIRKIDCLNLLGELDLSNTFIHSPKFSYDSEYLYMLRDGFFCVISTRTGLNCTTLPLPLFTSPVTIEPHIFYQIDVTNDDKFIVITLTQCNIASRFNTVFVIKREDYTFSLIAGLPLDIGSVLLDNDDYWIGSIKLKLESLHDSLQNLGEDSSLIEENEVIANYTPGKLKFTAMIRSVGGYEFYHEKKALVIKKDDCEVYNIKNIDTFVYKEKILAYHIDRKKEIGLIKFADDSFHPFSVSITVKIPSLFNSWRVEFLNISDQYLAFAIVRKSREDSLCEHSIVAVADLYKGSILFRLATPNMNIRNLTSCIFNDSFVLSDSGTRALFVINLKNFTYKSYNSTNHIFGMFSRGGFLGIVNDGDIQTVQVYTDLPVNEWTEKSNTYPFYNGRPIIESKIDYKILHVRNKTDVCSPQFKLYSNEWGDKSRKGNNEPYVKANKKCLKFPVLTSIKIDDTEFDSNLISHSSSLLHFAPSLHECEKSIVFSRSSDCDFELFLGQKLFYDLIADEEHIEAESESYHVTDEEEEEEETTSDYESSIQDEDDLLSDDQVLTDSFSRVTNESSDDGIIGSESEETESSERNNISVKKIADPGSGAFTSACAFSREATNGHFATYCLMPHIFSSYYTTKSILIESIDKLGHPFVDLFDYSNTPNEIDDLIIDITVESVEARFSEKKVSTLVYPKVKFKSGYEVAFVPNRQTPIVFLPSAYWAKLKQLTESSLQVRPLQNHLFRLPIDSKDMFPQHPHFDYAAFSVRSCSICRFYLKIKLSLVNATILYQSKQLSMEDIIEDLTRSQLPRLKETCTACFEDWLYNEEEPEVVDLKSFMADNDKFKVAPLSLVQTIPFAVIYLNKQMSKIMYEGNSCYHSIDLPIPSFNQLQLTVAFFAWVKLQSYTNSSFDLDNYIIILKSLLMRNIYSFEEFDYMLKISLKNEENTVIANSAIELFSFPVNENLAMKLVEKANVAQNSWDAAHIPSSAKRVYVDDFSDSFSENSASDEWVPQSEDENISFNGAILTKK